MEFRTLYYFLIIAREESFSKAAEKLHITQPTLSRQMIDFENEIGKQLFIRGRKKTTLTETGLVFKKRASEIISMVNKTEAELKATEEQLSGIVHIGCVDTAGLSYITNVINKVHTNQKSIKFDFIGGNNEDVLKKLDNDMIDIALVTEPVNLTNYDYFTLPVKDEWGILMNKNHDLTANDMIEIDDIRRYNILIPNHKLFKNKLAGWIGGNYRTFNNVDGYGSLYNAAILTKQTDSLAFVPLNTINDSDLCIKQFSNSFYTDIILVWKKYSRFSKITEYFMGLL